MRDEIARTEGHVSSKDSTEIRRSWKGHVWLCAGVLCMGALWITGGQYLSGFALDLGSPQLVTPRYSMFLLFWVVFGTLAACMVAVAMYEWSRAGRFDATLSELDEVSDAKLMTAFGLLGFAIPFALRALVLRDADITDDESSYRFMAEVLLSGRLYADSPPIKLFFDRAFMVNDGKFYSQYFLGWPALLAPGMALGIPGAMNPLYSALTVPPLYLLVRKLADRRFAVAAVLVFLTAPMIQFAAATHLSHTSCMFALAWAMYLALRASGGDVRLWVHAGFAFSFSVAFFIRPATTVGLGLPLLVVWATGLQKLDASSRLRAILTFAVPATVMGFLFFAANHVQNGSPTYVSYQRVIDYTRENGFRFAAWKDSPIGVLPSFRFGVPIAAVGRTVLALTRFNFAVFGWPFAFLFVIFAGWRTRKAWLFWACAAGFLLVHGFVHSAGIDTIGPVHYLELALPIVVLTALGLRRLTNLMQQAATEGGRNLGVWPVALFLGLISVSLFGYSTVRAQGIRHATKTINRPFEVAELTLDGRPLIFAPRPWVPLECSPTRNFVFWRPNNDPTLQNRILWVNHITVEHDLQLANRFPARDPYVMVWHGCMPVFVPLSQAPESVPAGFVGGSMPVPPPEEL